LEGDRVELDRDRFPVHRPIVAEFIVGDSPRRAAVGWNEMLGSGTFAVFTGVGFLTGAPPECGPGHEGLLAARWAGFAPQGWTDDGVDTELADADFHVATCRASVRLVARARARALLPALAYALRLKTDLGGKGRDERLIVFLPPSKMISTSGDGGLTLNESDSGRFTRLSLPLNPGHTSAAAFRVSPTAMRMWRATRAGHPAEAVTDESEPMDDLLIGLDVVWQGRRRTAMVSISLPEGSDRSGYGRFVELAGRPPIHR
jgi:hypothetical protein